MATIVNGKKIATQIITKLASQVKILKKKKIAPYLGVILVGEDKPSQTYVRKKGEACQKIDVKFILKKYPVKTSTEKLISQLKLLQKKEKLTGLIIQMPLPRHIDTNKVLEHLNPEIDVDCLTEKNLGKLINGSYQLEPPTPGAILEILKYHKINLVGQRVVLIGAGSLIGRPLANLLMLKRATVTVCNSATKNLKEITKQADILISGVGKYNLIRGTMVKKGVKVIDAGVSFYQGKMYGDINFNELKKKASLITPTPGGVGPLTVAKLIENVVKNSKYLYEKNK
jgi:methylenetetrahydrofolate dehydrogenase (NADP+) / methenyltetrahydrofolate cyclohydrolase